MLKKNALSWEYAITITLNPKLFKLTTRQQFEKTANEIVKFMKTMTTKLTLVTEVTEKYNIHYHGVFVTDRKNIQYKINNMVRGHKLFGFVMIKPVTDLGGWVEYLGKDIKKTKGMMNVLPIICNDFGFEIAKRYYKTGEDVYNNSYSVTPDAFLEMYAVEFDKKHKIIEELHNRATLLKIANDLGPIVPYEDSSDESETGEE